MKLYTRRGDDGGTDLFGGKRVGKDSRRVAAVGAVDELNSFVGLATAGCENAEIAGVLRAVQNRLFELGADLATPRKPRKPPETAEDAGKPSAIPRIGAEQARELECFIDRACEPLPEMRNFILPGGSELSARLHVARSVCRRAERECVALGREEEIGTDVVVYLNRLSDLLFALARRANQVHGVKDVPWVTRQG
jgi:cob(I)alamin adenosyltransferase